MEWAGWKRGRTLPGVGIQLVQARIAIGGGEGGLEKGELDWAAQIQHLQAEERASVGPRLAA